MAHGTNKNSKMRKILVKDLNDTLICTLCNGYLIDATTLVECLHVFCRGCILKYFESCKTGCPSCDTVFKKKNQPCLMPDLQLQSLVYKLVPGLYTKEMQRREDFYRSTGVRASSSCSDDSVLERERDLIDDQESLISSYVGDRTQFFGPEDSISLSLTYYQVSLDKTPIALNNGEEDAGASSQPLSTPSQKNPSSAVERSGAINDCNSNVTVKQIKLNGSKTEQDKESKDADKESSTTTTDGTKLAVNEDTDDKKKDATEEQSQKVEGVVERRYLQCPAGVTMRHLQKFIRMKYALTSNHRVDIIYEGEVLPDHFSLMDVAYTFKWNRLKPMRFFYRIFTPLKIQPIKIVNTTLSTGGKQLQIVPVKPSMDPPKPPPPPPPPVVPDPPKPAEPASPQSTEESRRATEEEKEHLMAHLQLQSKSKAAAKNQQSNKVPEKAQLNPQPKLQPSPPQVRDCVFEYEEPDKEEIKRFAENRDREWAMQKKLDETRAEESHHHSSRKRKKSKHSKNDFAYKKRKLHAEITNKEEDLKLKVKLTQHNGHKHKHHKSSSQAPAEMSSKEKILQMRQVRHKHVHSQDKNIQTLPSGSVSKETGTSTDNLDLLEKKLNKDKITVELRDKSVEVTLAPIKKVQPEQNTNGIKTCPVSSIGGTTKTPSNLSAPPAELSASAAKIISTKTPADKEWGPKVPTVQIERHEQAEKQAKSFQSYVEKYQNQKNLEKVQQNKAAPTTKPNSIPNVVRSPLVTNSPTTAPVRPPVSTPKPAVPNITPNRPANTNTPKPSAPQVRSLISNRLPNTNSQSLNRKIASLQQRCTIEPKPMPGTSHTSLEIKKPAGVATTGDTPKLITPQYPPGFTVSKIEQGVKRKSDIESPMQNKRPSLEITRIYPPITPSDANKSSPTRPTGSGATSTPLPAKRPPPATIPLDRIKKSINLKSGISIIPKLPDRCDNIGALDLSSKPGMAMKPGENSITAKSQADMSANPLNGYGVNKDKNLNMSNLQMLSKVAMEHPNLNKANCSVTSGVGTNVTKPRPQMPNLQTLKIPSLPNSPANMINSNNNNNNNNNNNSNSKPPPASLTKQLPKLTEISKTNYRMMTPPQRSNRPSQNYQNQSIRNIPNPSLLVRQNQNRLNGLTSAKDGTESSSKEQNVTNSDGSAPVTSAVTPASSSTTTTTVPPSTVAAGSEAPPNKVIPPKVTPLASLATGDLSKSESKEISV